MNNQELFEVARKLYPGKKVGFTREFANFEKRSTKPTPDGIPFTIDEVIPLLKPAIEYQIRYRAWCKEQNKWMAEWKNFQTWINKGCWEEEFPDFNDTVAPVVTEEQKTANRLSRDKMKKGLFANERI